MSLPISQADKAVNAVCVCVCEAWVKVNASAGP